MKKILISIILIGLMAATGCSTGKSTSSSIATSLPTPLAPTLATSVSVTSATSEGIASSTSSIATSTETHITSTTEISTSLSGLEVVSNKVEVCFPDHVTFSVSIQSPITVNSIILRYGTDKRSLVPEINSAEPEFKENNEIDTLWKWEMKKTGSLPPGATVRWWWEIRDADGNSVTTPEKTIGYEDTRFQWTKEEYQDYDIYWHDQSQDLINELLSSVKSGLSRLQLDVEIQEKRKPKVFIYTSSEELRDAILFEQEWTGALAYPSFNIILTAVNSYYLDWAKGALPHEITHLLMDEATFGPFGDIPLWLDEGMAKYSEGDLSSDLKELLDKAISENNLISIRSISSDFPVDPFGAGLSYAESHSIVTYLIEQYGWEKMRDLIATFKDGATYDKALLKVYSFDLDGLEDEWRDYLSNQIVSEFKIVSAA